jgi:hypothetical protein
MPPSPLPLDSIQGVLRWYVENLCNVTLFDPRGFRVRFIKENFVHLIKLRNKYGREPKNAGLAIDEIERGRIKFQSGRFDPQRTFELPWTVQIITQPDIICKNWQALGRGDEAYVKNFATPESPMYRVLICEVLGTVRQAVTVFPRERVGRTELGSKIWP